MDDFAYCQLNSGRNHCLSPGDLCKALSLSLTTYSTEQAQNSEARCRLIRNSTNHGLVFRGETLADGNCFFNAVSDQLERLALQKLSPAELRRRVVHKIRDNPIIQRPDGIVDLRNSVLEQWDLYCDRMSHTGVYADAIIVTSMACMLERDILIVTSSVEGGMDNCLTWVVGNSDNHDQPLLLGHIHEVHYQSLALMGTHNPLTFIEAVGEDFLQVAEGSTHLPVEVEALVEAVEGEAFFEALDGDELATIEERFADLKHKVYPQPPDTDPLDAQVTPTETLNTQFLEKENKKKLDLGLPQLSPADKQLLHMVDKGRSIPDIEKHFTILRSHSKDAFIKNILTKAEDDGLGAFTFKKLEVRKQSNHGAESRKAIPKEERADHDITHYYYCQRHLKTRSRSKQSEPTQTRANDCKAFIAFIFTELKDHDACAVEVRMRMHHTGHDPTDPNEWQKNRLDPRMRDYIENQCDQGKKVWEVLPLCWSYAKSLGHSDFRDRKFYPLPEDVTYLGKKVRQEKRFHKNDSISVHHMCTVYMEDRILLYQSQTDNRPLIIVYQNKDQLERLREINQNIVFMDASYKGLTGYGYAVYCLHGVKMGRGGIPLAYFILSKESKDILVECLKAVKERADLHKITFSPRSFMVDKDAKEISAINTVFPRADVLLCWFHVLQAVYRKLNERESGVSGTNGAPLRKDIVMYMRKMKYTSDKQKFLDMEKEIPNVFVQYPKVVHCLQHWVADAEKWANIGRKFCHNDQETNNIAERFFLELKYNYLGGYANRRVDDLLLLLDGGVSQYQSYMDNLEKANRLRSKGPQQPAGKLASDQLLLKGWDQKCQWVDDRTGQCLVPSANPEKPSYTVNLLLVTCTCSNSTQHGMCKHVHIALHIASRRGIDMRSKRRVEADQLVHEGAYVVFDQEVMVMGEDISTVTHGKRCTCVAASHGVLCICQMVATSVLNDNSSEVELPSLSGQTEMPVSPMEEEDESSRDSAGDPILSESTVYIMRDLLDIVGYMQSGRFENHPRRQEIERDIQMMGAKLSIPAFHTVTNQKKQKPNCPFRRDIEQHKRKKEHSYCDTKDKPSKRFHRMQGGPKGRRNVLS